MTSGSACRTSAAGTTLTNPILAAMSPANGGQMSTITLIEELDGVSTWKQRFAYGQGIDQVVMLEQADVLDYDGDSNTTEVIRNHYHRNVLGSIMYISEPDGSEGVSYRYSPYGIRTISRGGTVLGVDPLAQSHGHLGARQESLASTDWLNVDGRCVVASLGRFAQRRGDLSEGVSSDLYGFVFNSPMGSAGLLAGWGFPWPPWPPPGNSDPSPLPTVPEIERALDYIAEMTKQLSRRIKRCIKRCKNSCNSKKQVTPGRTNIAPPLSAWKNRYTSQKSCKAAMAAKGDLTSYCYSISSSEAPEDAKKKCRDRAPGIPCTCRGHWTKSRGMCKQIRGSRRGAAVGGRRGWSYKIVVNCTWKAMCVVGSQ